MDFQEVVKKRKSKRWYLDKEVPQELIQNIIDDAALAPSFMNGQPWEIAVVRGAKLLEITNLWDARQKENRMEHSFSWDIQWPERQKVILQKMHESRKGRILPDEPLGKWLYNAPVALFLHIHRELNEWAILDLGLFIQTLLLSATNLGVQTVPQARMGNNNSEVAGLLGLGAERRIIMGVAMGYAAEDHVNNQYHSTREDSKTWTTWH